MNAIQQFILSIFLLSFATISLAADTAQVQSKQERISQNGNFTVTIDSWLKPLELGRMHAWTANIRTADGKLVKDATIKVDGGMPIHNHGFPTQPEVTKQIEDGVYLIEGIKFSMRGPWVILLDITSNDVTDTVAFDVNM